MGGKAILLLVIGFSLIFNVVNFNSSNKVTRSVEKMNEYYSETTLHNILVSGTNIAISDFFRNPAGATNNYPVTYNFNNGSVSINVQRFNFDNIRITSQASLEGIYDHQLSTKTADMQVILAPSTFARYGYFSNTWSGGYLVTGDTIDGPFHVNDPRNNLNTWGQPVFTGRVTMRRGYTTRSDGKFSEPKFFAGKETNFPRNFGLNTVKIAAAAAQSGRLFKAKKNKTMDLRLKFIDDGTNKGKVEWSTRTLNRRGRGAWTTPVLANMDTLAPNGVIWNNKGNLYLSGTVNGKYSVGTGMKGNNNLGKIYLEDDIVYRKDPLLNDPHASGLTISNPECKDMLGIVAENQIEVVNNAANRDNINIHGALFSYKGGITVQNLTSRSPIMGSMNIRGSLVENASQTTGYVQFRGRGSNRRLVVTAGYQQRIRHDKRFANATPPFFPSTGDYVVVSWFE